MEMSDIKHVGRERRGEGGGNEGPEDGIDE